MNPLGPPREVGPGPASVYRGKVTATAAGTVSVQLTADPYDLDNTSLTTIVALGTGYTVGADCYVVIQSATAYAVAPA